MCSDPPGQAKAQHVLEVSEPHVQARQDPLGGLSFEATLQETSHRHLSLSESTWTCHSIQTGARGVAQCALSGLLATTSRHICLGKFAVH